MEMIGHQDVGKYLALTFALGLSKAFQEKPVIIIGEKRSTAVVSPLDNVMGISGNGDSWRSCHAASQMSDRFVRNLSPDYNVVKKKVL
jgi:hypothetical protein